MRALHVSLVLLPLLPLVACGSPKSPTAPSAPPGIDGEFSSDPPPDTLHDGSPACRADYEPGGRNPGLVRIERGRFFSFYTDRAGRTPIAQGCSYAYRGARPDPRWYGTGSDQSLTDVWTLFELEPGSPACDPKFHFVALRTPEGEGPLRHMHLRYGDPDSSFDALVAMSSLPMRDGMPCEPWWSVYCVRGQTGCDPQ